MSSATVSPASMVCAGIVPSANGARLGTVTWKLCAAVRPPGSVAVTVTAIVPFATATTVTISPVTDTTTPPVSDATV